MIELTDRIINQEFRRNAVKRFRDKGITLPTFEEMRHPELIPEKIINRLQHVGLWDLDPVNLYRITWKNEPVEKGGGFGKVNFLEIPSSLTGVDARIIMLTGKWFPTGAHKVGAAYGCLAPRIVSGQFDPTFHKAVWPSTGNYCRGGAFDSYLMGCTAVAILPEEMSQERFTWLKDIGAEVIATPGCESNVKEIYDKCWEIRRTRPDCIIFNQFDEFGNSVWHYHITGPAMEEVFQAHGGEKSRFSAFISNTGSAGTIAAGDYLRTRFPQVKVVASEALQCPTLLMNGFGGHRIEGIGDKHVPWVHNIRNTDVVTAIDDEACMRLLRLFNEPSGQGFLTGEKMDQEFVQHLPLLGISSIANLLAAIKVAKYYEYTCNDVIVTVATDSADLYQSRIGEMSAASTYSTAQATKDYERFLLGENIHHLKELTYADRKAVHNLKYFTWVEQQGKEVADLNRLWYDEDIWPALFNQPVIWDDMIREFNRDVAGG